MPKSNPVADIATMAMNASPMGAMLGKVLSRADVPLDNAKVPATVAKVQTAMASAGMVAVPVKSGWASKINWTQVAGPGASTIAVLLGFFGLDLKPDAIIGLIMAIQTIQSIVTWIIRQWFPSSVTAASMVPPLTKE